MQQPWPACRSAKGVLYIWSQSTSNSIILERVSCVSSIERLFTCAEPRCYFASPGVFIMLAFFCLLVGGVSNMLSLQPLSFCPNLVSMFLFINSQYPFTVCLCPIVLFLAFSLYHKELQPYLIAWLKIEPLVGSPAATSSWQNVGCLREFFVYVLWRMLPKQDMPISVEQPSALSYHCVVVFFFFQTSANSCLKRMKNGSNGLCPLVRFFFFHQCSKNSRELSRVNS